MSALSYSVKLFRLLEQPSIGGSNVFSSRNIILTKDIVEAVYGAWRYPSSGFSVEVVIGADRLTGGDKDPQTLESKIGEKANNIKVELSRKDDGQFYRGINDFVARAKTLNTGRLPEEFYIVDRDYHYPNDKDSKSDPYIAKLEGLCLFIDAIKHHICHFHDVTPTGKSRAILVISDDSNKSLSPKSIELKFTEELLELDSIPDLTLLNELRLPAALPHKEEKLSTLRVSIWEYLSYAKADDSTIYYLAFNWPDILDKYRASYELYIRGFSFNKFSNEVSDFIYNAIKNANELVNDVVVKTLSVPSLFAVWLFVLRSPNFDWKFAFGLCFVILFGTIIVSFQLENQLYLVNQVKSRTLNSLIRFHRRLGLSNEPEDDRDEIGGLIDGFSKDFEQRLKIISNRLQFMRFSIWAFLIAAVIATIETGWVYSISTIPIYFIILACLGLVYIVISAIKANRK